MKPLSKKHRIGTTLVEVIICTLLVGVVLVAALETVGSAIRLTLASEDVVTGNLLADQLLGELMSLPYRDPDEETTLLGLDTGEGGTLTNREDADDVDDLNGWNRSPPEAPDGTPLTAYAGWTRKARIDFMSQDADEDGKLAYWGSDNGVKLVVVDLHGPNGLYFQRQAIRTVHGVAEMPTALDATLVTAISARLVAGESKEVATAIDLTNEAEAPE